MASIQTERASVAQSAIEVSLAAASVGLACLAFMPFFSTGRWLLPVLGGVLVGSGLAVVSHVLRWPAWVLAPACLLVLVVYEVYALYPSKTRYGLPGLEALRATGSAIASGWAGMLTVALPADSDPGLVAFPALLALVGTFVACVLALRSRVVVALCLPAVLVLVVALAMTAARGERVIGTALGILVVLFVLVLARANRSTTGRGTVSAAQAHAVGMDLEAERSHSTMGRVLFGLPSTIIVVLLAVTGAFALPIADGSDRADPRELREPEIDLEAGLSPLVELKSQLTGPEEHLYRVQVEGVGATPVDRIRLAALDHFDGALWSQSGSFVLAGTELPHPSTPSAGADVVSLDVEVLSERSPYLPVVGQPLTLTGTEVAIEEASGSLIRATETTQSGGTVTYHLTAEVAHQARVDEAGPPASSAPGLTALPDMPAWVVTEAQTAMGEFTTPWTQLSGLETYLRDHPYSVDARPGHSYGALQRTLVGTDAEPGQEPGYAEQYASAFAVLARAMGYPTRVAVGYMLDPEKLEDSTYTVDTTDVHAWAEVLIEGYGWFAFDPTDTGNPAGPQPPRDPEAAVLLSDAAVPQPAQPDQAADTGGREQPGGSALATIARTSIYLVVGVIAAVLLGIITVVMVKIIRRVRRRSTGSPSRQIAAAWREATDRLREFGYPVPPFNTPVEIARSAESGSAKAGCAELAELALIATTAVCAPGEPTSAAARRAWELESEFRERLDAQIPLGRRLLAWIDPRPLFVRRNRGADHDTGAQRASEHSLAGSA